MNDKFIGESNFENYAGRTWRSLWELADGSFLVRTVWYGQICYWVKDPRVCVTLEEAEAVLSRQYH